MAGMNSKSSNSESFSTINTLPNISRRVSSLITASSTAGLLSAYGLKANRVTWEDTGRNKNSCWGPNISDMTLVIKDNNLLMPVIRTPNFADVTQDVPIENFRLNYKGSVISLKALLKDYNLYDDRDKEILTSSQCCVLPVVPGEKTEFAVQLFNYQSTQEEPAVLVILVSKLDTSIQVLDSANTKLFFDDNKVAKWFSVERLEDVRKRQGVAKTRVDSFKEMTNEEQQDNTILVIQVPLKQKARPTRGMSCGAAFGAPAAFGSAPAFNSAPAFGSAPAFNSAPAFGSAYTTEINHEMTSLYMDRLESLEIEDPVYRSIAPAPSGMDMGQIGLGSSAGPYLGTKNITLVRDTDYPIRCTYQYYRVTDVDYIDETMIKDIKEQLDQSLKNATHSGSLVLSESNNRLTEPAQKPYVPLMSANSATTPTPSQVTPTPSQVTPTHSVPLSSASFNPDFPIPDAPFNPQFPFHTSTTARVKCPCCNTSLSISIAPTDHTAPSKPVFPPKPDFPFRQGPSNPTFTPHFPPQFTQPRFPSTTPFNLDPAVVTFGAPSNALASASSESHSLANSHTNSLPSMKNWCGTK
jgi:hypothetical protein